MEGTEIISEASSFYETLIRRLLVNAEIVHHSPKFLLVIKIERCGRTKIYISRET